VDWCAAGSGLQILVALMCIEIGNVTSDARWFKTCMYLIPQRLMFGVGIHCGFVGTFI